MRNNFPLKESIPDLTFDVLLITKLLINSISQKVKKLLLSLKPVLESDTEKCSTFVFNIENRHFCKELWYINDYNLPLNLDFSLRIIINTSPIPFSKSLIEQTFLLQHIQLQPKNACEF